MCEIVDTVEDRIQNAILPAIGSIITPKIEIAVRSRNKYSGRDATSVTANSESGKAQGLLPVMKTHPEKINTLSVLNTNDESQNNISDEVSELSVAGIAVDHQPHNHHSVMEYILKILNSGFVDRLHLESGALQLVLLN